MSINIDTLREYKEKGLLKCQKHPTLPLVIRNYSEKPQFSEQWDDITLNARALITDEDG